MAMGALPFQGDGYTAYNTQGVALGYVLAGLSGRQITSLYQTLPWTKGFCPFRATDIQSLYPGRCPGLRAYWPFRPPITSLYPTLPWAKGLLAFQAAKLQKVNYKPTFESESKAY